MMLQNDIGGSAPFLVMKEDLIVPEKYEYSLEENKTTKLRQGGFCMLNIQGVVFYTFFQKNCVTIKEINTVERTYYGGLYRKIA